MSQVPADRNDGRRRYTHQAFDVTYLGKGLETGPSGYGQRLSATYDANILMTAPADVATAQAMGDVTQGVFIRGIVNHAALTTGTLVLTLPAWNGLPEQIINTQAVDLTTPGIIFTGMNALNLAPLSEDRPMTATIATGTADEVAVFSLMVTPAENGWF